MSILYGSPLSKKATSFTLLVKAALRQGDAQVGFSMGISWGFEMDFR